MNQSGKSDGARRRDGEVSTGPETYTPKRNPSKDPLGETPHIPNPVEYFSREEQKSVIESSDKLGVFASLLQSDAEGRFEDSIRENATPEPSGAPRMSAKLFVDQKATASKIKASHEPLKETPHIPNAVHYFAQKERESESESAHQFRLSESPLRSDVQEDTIGKVSTPEHTGAVGRTPMFPNKQAGATRSHSEHSGESLQDGDKP